MVSKIKRNAHRTNVTFDEQLQRSYVADAHVDNYLRSHQCRVEPVGMDQQFRGIDRLVKTPSGREWTVEYKADWVAARTGNAFIETAANDVTGRPGWAFTAQADWLVYYVPPHGIAYVVPFIQLRLDLPRWCREYSGRHAMNYGYRTYGVIVPLPEVAAIAVQRFVIPGLVGAAA